MSAMNVEFIENLEDEDLSEQILKILTAANDEFVPPLTSRNSTTQSDFFQKSEPDKAVPYAYFDMLKEQKTLVMRDGGRVVGFMSYKTDYENAVITKDFLPNVYISTVVTDKMFRHQGVTKGLYGALFERYGDKSIFTRTWSTNLPHTRLLGGFGFAEFKRIKGDRGDGIDTVYYFKRKL